MVTRKMMKELKREQPLLRQKVRMVRKADSEVRKIDLARLFKDDKKLYTQIMAVRIRYLNGGYSDDVRTRIEKNAELTTQRRQLREKRTTEEWLQEFEIWKLNNPGREFPSFTDEAEKHLWNGISRIKSRYFSGRYDDRLKRRIEQLGIVPPISKLGRRQVMSREQAMSYLDIKQAYVFNHLVRTKKLQRYVLRYDKFFPNKVGKGDSFYIGKEIKKLRLRRPPTKALSLEEAVEILGCPPVQVELKPIGRFKSRKFDQSMMSTLYYLRHDVLEAKKKRSSRYIQAQEKHEKSVGKTFGRLEVLHYFRRKKRTYFECLCKCGKKVVVATNKLWNGSTKSCGCFSRDSLRQRRQKLTNRQIQEIQRSAESTKILARRYNCSTGTVNSIRGRYGPTYGVK